MIELNKKTILILLVVVIVIAAAAAGAMMYKPEEAKAKPPKGVEASKDLPTQSGWISSPDSADGGPTEATISANVNDTELLSVTVTVLIKDDDGAHQQTDEGSEPDTVSIKVGEDTFELITDPASGMVNITKEYGTSDMHMFNDSLTVTVSGVEFGGGKHPTGPIGIVPIPFLVYIDQGAQYEVSISYTYMDYSGKQTQDKDKEETK